MPESLSKSESLDRTNLRKSVAVLIVAAGAGVRAGGELPKQYQQLAGKMLLRHTINAFLNHPHITNCLVVMNPDDRPLYDHAVAGLNLHEPAHGGASRSKSVLNGLKALDAMMPKPDYVLVHDAARPFVSGQTIDNVIDCLEAGTDGALPALVISDTVKRIQDSSIIAETIDRTGLYSAQTPQGFPLSALLAANAQVEGDFTDDASIAEAAGMKVQIVPGDIDNFKITRAEDFIRAERYIMQRLVDIRVGQGFDVHRFTSGDHIWLGGVKIAHDQSLMGHSDADVALHALTDALLGAMALGDIGDHFPPSDDEWAGASSDRFVRFAGDKIRDVGGLIANVDVTIICEAPKISPYKAEMMERIAQVLQIDLSRVSVKATTTEKLGFTGRGEGIAAQATATIRLPYGNSP